MVVVLQVYVYDPKETQESQGCCERKRLIMEEFPSGIDGNLPLPANLEATHHGGVSQRH
jgi:hypothetical protein